MDVISAVGGFLVGGVLATVFSDAIAAWLVRLMPIRESRRLGAIADNPRLYLRLLRDTEERKIGATIGWLFKAWEQQDQAAYAACWADDAVRMVGVQTQIEERKDDIIAKFRKSCGRYAHITVASLVFQSISLAPDEQGAIAHVRYRFQLERLGDHLPIVEDAREVYSLRRTDRGWLVTANIDHFYEIGDAVASSGES